MLTRGGRQEYLDWAEAVVRACPLVSEALPRSFKEALEEGRPVLAAHTAVPPDEPSPGLPD